MFFEGFDFTDFWEDDAYALNEYVNDPPSDQLIDEVEKELGYKLPASYIWLMKRHNGGIPANTCFPTDVPTSWAEDHVAVTGLFGIGRDKQYSLCGGLGSQFMIDEWEYPAIGVAICDCPSAGHDMIFLDYRACGPQGEPKVVHIDQEADYEITPLADSFEEFIRGLVNEEEYEEDAEACREEDLNTVRNAPFSPLLLELCQKTGEPEAAAWWIREIAVAIVEDKGYFAIHADENSYLLYDIQFWLYENAHPGVTEEDYLKDYPRIIAFAEGFSTEGYAPRFVTEWLQARKKSGMICKRNGALVLSDAAKAEMREQLAAAAAQLPSHESKSEERKVDANMTLLEQCQLWNENDEYQKIIDAIESVPAENRTPEQDSELARAYNNLAAGEDSELFEKAISLLKPHEEYFKDDHNWNFRMAYAYYYLDQEGPALHYFEKALEARPGDEDTQELIDDCRSRLSLPRFEKNFRERTLEAWEAFEQGEAELRRLMDQEDREAISEELISRCSDILEIAFKNPAFELGFNGEKYELILPAEVNRARLFPLVYFQRHAPASIRERWNIWVGRQPAHGFALRSGDCTISESDVRVWVEKQDNDEISLTLYCEKMLPMLKENENKVWWMLSNLTDQVLGEIVSIALIHEFEVVDVPREEASLSLAELPAALENMGLTLCNDAETYLENSYMAYELEPVKDPEADWRLDAYVCLTRLPVLISEYLCNKSEVMDDYHIDGAVAGFLGYPIDGFEGENWAKDALDFREALKEAILENAGEAVTILGGSTGLYCSYLDFIAWDLPAVLNAAEAFFMESQLPWAVFHALRRNANTVRLLNREDGKPEAELKDGAKG